MSLSVAERHLYRIVEERAKADALRKEHDDEVSQVIIEARHVKRWTIERLTSFATRIARIVSIERDIEEIGQ